MAQREHVEFEAEGPDGITFRFKAPADSTEEQLKRYAYTEYQLRTKGDLGQGSVGKPSEPSIPLPEPEQEAPESPESLEERVRTAGQEQDIRQAQLYGGAAGAGVTAGRVGRDVAGGMAQTLANRAELGRMAAQQSAGMLNTPDQTARILQGTPGDTAGTTGRARSTGFNVEEAQRAARAKEAEKLIEQLVRGGAVAQTAPQVLAGGPGLTASPSGIVYPRGVTPPPVPTPSPTVPRTGGLDAVTNIFKSMLGMTARYAIPPIALAGAAGEGIRAKQQLSESDRLGAALSGISALSGLASLSPAVAPLAIPVGLGAGALQYMRSRLAPNAPVSPREEEEASRAATGIYPAMGRRRVPVASP